eukprot:1944416-Rhodomonas_salina.3
MDEHKKIVNGDRTDLMRSLPSGWSGLETKWKTTSLSEDMAIIFSCEESSRGSETKPPRYKCRARKGGWKGARERARGRKRQRAELSWERAMLSTTGPPAWNVRKWAGSVNKVPSISFCSPTSTSQATLSSASHPDPDPEPPLAPPDHQHDNQKPKPTDHNDGSNDDKSTANLLAEDSEVVVLPDHTLKQIARLDCHRQRPDS